jgi:hypothetical protein
VLAQKKLQRRAHAGRIAQCTAARGRAARADAFAAPPRIALKSA